MTIKLESLCVNENGELRIDLPPTWDRKVKIPRPGKEPAWVKFTFKNRTRTEYRDFMEETEDADDETIVKAMVVGWEFKEPFTDENVHALCENFIAAPMAIFNAYRAGLRGEPLEA